MTGTATLERALAQAVGTGKAGTIVSLRALLHLPDPQADLACAVGVLLDLAGTLLETAPARLTARRHTGGQQLNVLLDVDSGPIVSVSATRGSVEAIELSLVVLGNHGVIRLEGAELAAEMGLSGEAFTRPSETWQKRITQAAEEAS